MAINDYVRVFTLDFTKAFNTVRHSSLMCKLAKTNLRDAVYNWSHCMKFQAEVSELVDILASVV